MSATPIRTVSGCAKAIVNSACRGDKYLTDPAWFRMTWLWKVFCPDVLEWCYRLLQMTRPGEPAAGAPSKKVLDMTGGKKVLYPETVQTPELKKE